MACWASRWKAVPKAVALSGAASPSRLAIASDAGTGAGTASPSSSSVAGSSLWAWVPESDV